MFSTCGSGCEGAELGLEAAEARTAAIAYVQEGMSHDVYPALDQVAVIMTRESPQLKKCSYCRGYHSRSGIILDRAELRAAEAAVPVLAALWISMWLLV